MDHFLWIYSRNRHYPYRLDRRGNEIGCHLLIDVIPKVFDSSLNVPY